MPKSIEDIIVPERKRSIRDIPIPEGRRKNIISTPTVTPEESYYQASTGSRTGRSRWREKKGIWIATGIALLVLTFSLLSIFNGATLSYVPKSTSITFADDIYKAEKAGNGELIYSIVKLSGDKGLGVSASGEEELSRKASGKIIVYNSTTQSQRFRATTRFETPDGKVYQVPDTIVVPAKKTVGGVEELGTLEVVVYAEQPGAESNIGFSDFALPGLKGTSLFSSVYARSKTEMSGGFVGVQKIVESVEMVKAKANLEVALRDELMSEAKAQVPGDFILFSSLSSVTFEDLPQTSSDSKDKVTINMRANLFGVMFKKSDLSTHLASKKISLVEGELVDIVELESITLAFAGTTLEDLMLSDQISFSVTGPATVLWRTDEVALKADLVGKHKRNILSVLNNYPTIASATATVRPFWKGTFPENSTHISIKRLPVK